MSTKQKVLFVDDEPNVLDGFRRQLRKRFDVETALGGEEGLKKLQDGGPFPVVVSDMKMPGMNGAEFLARVRELEPDTVRMILSGQSELDAAISAINDGAVFRFLTKPCETETLARGLEIALEQHRLIVAEKELLEKTLFGAVDVLTQILSLVNPEAFSRAARIRQYAEGVAASLGIEDDWQIRLAAMLSQIGCISLPQDLLSKAHSEDELSEEESELFSSHPCVAAKLVGPIPRLETVSKMIAGQLDACDLLKLPGDPLEWEPALLGSQILRAAVEFERMLGHGAHRVDAVQQLKKDKGVAPALADPLLNVAKAEEQTVTKSLGVDSIATRMVLDQDVKTTAGMLLVRRGEEITYPMLLRLRNFAKGQGVEEPVRVLVSV